MTGAKLKHLRERLGLSQTELAARAGVSRQLVGALEAGRHLPRVDAALGLADALGVGVSHLFGPEKPPLGVISGDVPVEGATLRLGQVGDQTVFSEARVEASGWDSADAVVEGGRVVRLSSPGAGPVMVGCEPGLEALERSLRESGKGAMAVGCSSRTATATLGAGRAHVAVVHGSGDHIGTPGEDVTRFRLCSWQVGLAAPSDAGVGWAEDALGGRVPVVQRESGASVQAAFEKVAEAGVDGPITSSHVEAARLAIVTGMPAVTIEPAALALGAKFHPLETHVAELWVAGQWTGDPVIEAVLNEVTGNRFRRRLLGVGGYDLTDIGARAA